MDTLDMFSTMLRGPTTRRRCDALAALLRASTVDRFVKAPSGRTHLLTDAIGDALDLAGWPYPEDEGELIRVLADHHRAGGPMPGGGARMILLRAAHRDVTEEETEIERAATGGHVTAPWISRRVLTDLGAAYGGHWLERAPGSVPAEVFEQVLDADGDARWEWLAGPLRDQLSSHPAVVKRYGYTVWRMLSGRSLTRVCLGLGTMSVMDLGELGLLGRMIDDIPLETRAHLRATWTETMFDLGHHEQAAEGIALLLRDAEDGNTSAPAFALRIAHKHLTGDARWAVLDQLHAIVMRTPGKYVSVIREVNRLAMSRGGR